MIHMKLKNIKEILNLTPCKVIGITGSDGKTTTTTLINEILKAFNIENVTLEVKMDNINAINLYEKLGFKKASIRKGYYNGVDGILMIKEVR